MNKNHFLLRLIVFILAIAAALYASAFFMPIRGDWVDGVASRVLSRAMGFQIKCTKAQMVRWSEISFDKLEAGLEPSNRVLTSGAGNIYLSAIPYHLIQLTDVRLSKTIDPTMIFSSLPISKSLGREPVIHRLIAGWTGDRVNGFIHLFECSSDDFELKGGVRWVAGRVSRAHLYLSISPEQCKRLPKEIAKRMIRKDEGWLAVRIIYSQGALTLSGLKGPMFRAEWKG